jgi:hypothetical protein
MITGLAIGLFIVALVAARLAPAGMTMNGAFVMDEFARTMKILIFAAAAIACRWASISSSAKAMAALSCRC